MTLGWVRRVYGLLGWPLEWVDAAWERAVIRAASRMREGDR